MVLRLARQKGAGESGAPHVRSATCCTLPDMGSAAEPTNESASFSTPLHIYSMVRCNCITNWWLWPQAGGSRRRVRKRRNVPAGTRIQVIASPQRRTPLGALSSSGRCAAAVLVIGSSNPTTFHRAHRLNDAPYMYQLPRKEPNAHEVAPIWSLRYYP